MFPVRQTIFSPSGAASRCAVPKIEAKTEEGCPLMWEFELRVRLAAKRADRLRQRRSIIVRVSECWPERVRTK